MAEQLTCPECGKEIESADDLEEHEHSLPELEVSDRGINPYRDEEKDLFLCEGCKNPLGIRRD